VLSPALIAWREIRSRIGSPAFLVTALGLPVYTVLVGLGTLWVATVTFSELHFPVVSVDYVDEAGLLPPGETFHTTIRAFSMETANVDVLHSSRFVGRPSFGRALADLNHHKVSGILQIPRSYWESGDVRWYTNRAGLGDLPQYWVLLRAVPSLIRENLGLAKLPTTAAILASNSAPWSYVELRGGRSISKTEGDVMRTAADFIVLLLVLGVSLSAGALFGGLLEERKSGLLETLLSAVDARRFLWGKILGIGTLGFAQVLMWVLIGAIPLAAVDPKLVPGLPLVAAICCLFVLGYLLYATLAMLVGSLARLENYALHAVSVILLPLYLVGAIAIMGIEDPTRPFLKFLFYFPLTSPGMVPIMAARGGAAWWELTLSIVVLVVTDLSVLFAAGSLFRKFPGVVR